ncbi:DUF1642 domain-containing protein [Enterococcus dongliensis]|uniref:DUF1642 domain-containing protein n=1 Tax=Enterococcus dongliensis TaxID=2559925 RepID=UPI00288F6855|nr:DUF1642 domain-containing protein [Enterococcus dongliensis]MDT2677302.1 DUF1642 domain-containing protein [Enterococcus dongliensis]
MNKKELIEKLKEHGAWCTECHDTNGEKDRYVKVAKVRELLEQQDEPQKVKVPAFVAEWFEKHKHRLGYSIWKLVGESHKSYTTNKLDMRHWILQEPNNPIETLIRMKDGYEVEEEPKWVVKSNRLYFTGITQLIARDPITYNFTTDENRAHVFDDKESAEKEASFFDGTIEKVEE